MRGEGTGRVVDRSFGGVGIDVNRRTKVTSENYPDDFWIGNFGDHMVINLNVDVNCTNSD